MADDQIEAWLKVGELLGRFSEESGRSHSDIAQALTLVKARPGGKNVSKTMVYNYASGITRVPGWFEDAMDRVYPGWREYSRRNEWDEIKTYGGATGPEFADGRDRLPTKLSLRNIPTLSPITSYSWWNTLEMAAKGGGFPLTDGDILFPEALLRSSLAFAQRVNPQTERQYSPLLRVGDLVLVDPSIYPIRNTLHAITTSLTTPAEQRMLDLLNEHAQSTDRPLKEVSHYASCVDRDGQTFWALNDGRYLDFDDCNHKGAVVGIFPQYSAYRLAGTINDQGLDTAVQIKWPTIFSQ